MKAVGLFEHMVIGATSEGTAWDDNTHAIFLKEETAEAFIGWPDPACPGVSPHWKVGQDKPLMYPKFAWERKAS